MNINNSNTNTNNAGISSGGLLTIVFIALKLMGYIDWPWIWVLSPIWIGILIVVLALIIIICVGGRR